MAFYIIYAGLMKSQEKGEDRFRIGLGHYYYQYYNQGAADCFSYRTLYINGCHVQTGWKG